MIIPHDAEECECCEKTLALRAEVERLKGAIQFCSGSCARVLDASTPAPRTFTEEHVTTAFLRAHLADNGIVDLNVFLKALLKEKS